MTTTNKFYNNLGLAMRAGKIATGEDGVQDAVRSGEAKLVVLSEDAAGNIEKKIRDKCATYNVPLIEYGSREELGASIGKLDRVVIAVIDAGFAQMIAKSLTKPAEVKHFE